MSTPATIDVRADGGRLRLVMSGEIDVAAVEPATSRLDALPLPIEGCTVDMAAVTFLDSVAIGFLLELRNRSGRPVQLEHAPDHVVRLLQATGVHGLFGFASSDV